MFYTSTITLRVDYCHSGDDANWHCARSRVAGGNYDVPVLSPASRKCSFVEGQTKWIFTLGVGCEVHCHILKSFYLHQNDNLSNVHHRFNNDRRFGGRGGGVGYRRVKQTELELTSTPMLDADLDSADLEGMQG